MSKKKSDKLQMLLPIPGVLYDQRFLESHAGSRILHDPTTAIVELVANAWDAGATEVRISWPDGKTMRRFAIQDNGTGMTDAEFGKRWRTLNYNRAAEQGLKVVFPENAPRPVSDRFAFGRNGIGRWSGFCFGEHYYVDTHKDGTRNRYEVRRGLDDAPFQVKQLVTTEASKKNGTTVECPECRRLRLTPDDARADIGMRFLTDPSFRVWLNGEAVSFEHIDDPNITKLSLDVPGGDQVELIIIDTQRTDRTTKQHGVAWHVGGRLVGTCSWKGTATDDLIDGRRIAAKRFTFIVRADHLAAADAIKKDWSGFETDNEQYAGAAQVVHEKVREYLLSVSEADRKQTLAKARQSNEKTLKSIGPLGREKWAEFVTQAQVTCPLIKEADVVKLSQVVANMEQARSGYALLHKLSEYGPDQLDELHKLLDDWTLDMAKVVLDEVGRRLKLVDELRIRINDKKTKEVQDLQPLFERGLWIFGPEFETIEYTSNEGMTRVVQQLFKHPEQKGSRNRPDFAILPDGTSGLYSYPRYDEDGGAIGIERLVVVELKKPGVTIGTEQKAQCWKYVKELYDRGLLQEQTRVTCFSLGKTVDKHENSERTEKDGAVTIRALLFDTVLERAKGRMLKLCDRVKDAPFLKNHRDELEAFLRADTPEMGLLETVGTQLLPSAQI